MEDTANALAKTYDDSAAVGRDFIRQCWSLMDAGARAWLVASKHFDEHGRPQQLNYGEGAEDAEQFFYEVGILKRCADSTLPYRSDANGVIPSEALNGEVLGAAGSLLHSSVGRDPSFLRLALSAIRQREIALLLTRLPALKKDRFPIVRAIGIFGFLIFVGLLVLASPALLGNAIASAAKGDTDSTVLALYGLAFVALMAGTLRNFSKLTAETLDEKAHAAWIQLHHMTLGPWQVTGVGTRAYLEKMIGDGILVPPVALDICAALSARMQQAA